MFFDLIRSRINLRYLLVWYNYLVLNEVDKFLFQHDNIEIGLKNTFFRTLLMLNGLFYFGCHDEANYYLTNPYQDALSSHSIIARAEFIDSTFYDSFGRVVKEKGFGRLEKNEYDLNGFIMSHYNNREGSFEITKNHIGNKVVQTWYHLTEENSERSKEVEYYFEKDRLIRKIEKVYNYPTLSGNDITFLYKYNYRKNQLHSEEVYMEQPNHSRKIQLHQYYYENNQLVRKESTFFDKKPEPLTIEEFDLDNLRGKVTIDGRIIEVRYLIKKELNII